MARSTSLWAIIILVIASLACNLTLDSDDSSDGEGSGIVSSGIAPVVSITSPQNNQEANIGQQVDIQVNASHPQGIDRIILRVDDRVASSKTLTDNPTNVDVILTWTPDRQGQFTIEVQALHGPDVSELVGVTLRVFPEGTNLSNPVSGQSVAAVDQSVCNGRILISNLNMRDGPGTSFGKVGSFAINENVTVVGRNFDNQSREWYKVRRDSGQEVWVINQSQWLETSGNCGTLGTVN